MVAINHEPLTIGLLAMHLNELGMGEVPFVCEAESNNRETSVVVCTCFTACVLLLALFILQIALLSVNVAHATVPTGMLQCSAQQARVGKRVFHDTAVSAEAQVYQIVCSYQYQFRRA